MSACRMDAQANVLQTELSAEATLARRNSPKNEISRRAYVLIQQFLNLHTEHRPFVLAPTRWRSTTEPRLTFPPAPDRYMNDMHTKGQTLAPNSDPLLETNFAHELSHDTC